MHNSLAGQERHYRTVARAIAFIRSHARQQPELGEIAAHIGLSEQHFQRVFSEWAGISPKRFLQYLTKEYAREALRGTGNVLAVAHDAGLSGPGRLHDLMVTCEAMSPGEIKAMGAGLEIRFGEAPTPFGHALIAWTGRGICHLAFTDDSERTAGHLRQEWPRAGFVRDDLGAGQYAAIIFGEHATRQQLHLMLRGTNFQIRVWEALLSLTPGESMSYGRLAEKMAMPRAGRSVGTAIAKNNIALLIPCHRVIRESGEIGSYRWGATRKAAMLAREAAQAGTRP